MDKIKIPSKQECISILTKNKTPSNVIGHCKSVCKVAEEVADKLIGNGIKVNKDLVIASALLHDIERHKKDHINEGAKLLKEMGFPEIAVIIKKHSLYLIEENDVQPKTIEEKIVFYADKRAKGSKIVSLEERFEDLKERYKMDFIKEIEFTKKIERELLQ